MIRLTEPSITAADIDRVRGTMLDGWLSTAGPVVDEFERALCQAVGLGHAVATNTGSSALQLALCALDVGDGDDVLVTDLSFIAPGNAIRQCGAIPRFVDSKELDWQQDTSALEEQLNEYGFREGRALHRLSGRRLGAVVVVHLLGSLADLPMIRRLAQHRDIPLVEDGAQAMGARWDGLPFGLAGSGENGVRVVCTSFNGNKLVTTGAGGAVMTDDAHLAQRMRHLASVARVADRWDYLHDEVGFNVRMNSLSAALGLAQLDRLPELVTRSRKIAAHLMESVASIDEVAVMSEPPSVMATHWNLAVRLTEDSRAAAQRLFDVGIESRRPWLPLRRQAPFRNESELIPSISDKLWKQGLLLPCRPSLTDAEVETLAMALPRTLIRQPL